MFKNKKTILCWVALFLFLWAVLSAATPQKINYQGKLTENGSPVTATKTMYFFIKDNNDTTLWSSGAQTVGVVNGVYNVTLEPPASLFDTSAELKLHIKVGSTDLSPDIQLVAVPYAYIAKIADTVTNNAAAGNSVISALNAAGKTVPTGTIVGDTDTQTLTNKTMSTGSTWSGNTVTVGYGGTGSTNGSITGTTALNFTAGGTNQNVNVAPSGTGQIVLNGTVVLAGTTGPSIVTASNVLTISY